MMGSPRFIYATYPAATTVTATDSAPGCDPLDILEANEDLSWQPANTTGAKSLTIDLGMPLVIGSLGISGEYLAGCSVEIRASSDAFAVSNVQLVPATMIGENIAAWAEWPEASYRWWRLTFTNLAGSFELYHAALCRNLPLPYMADGPSLRGIKGIGKHLFSPGSQYLGSVQQGAERPLKLPWGQVTAAEEQTFSLWADACIRMMQGFFFVPDSSSTECYFGTVPDNYEYNPPCKLGLYNIGSITFTSRSD